MAEDQEESRIDIQDEDDMSAIDIETLEEHISLFQKLGFCVTHNGNESGVVYMNVSDISHDNWMKFPRENSNVPFIGHMYEEQYHTALYCDGTDYTEIYINENELPIIVMEPDGTLNEDDIRQAREGLELKNKIELLFKMRIT